MISAQDRSNPSDMCDCNVIPASPSVSSLSKRDDLRVSGKDYVKIYDYPLKVVEDQHDPAEKSHSATIALSAPTSPSSSFTGETSSSASSEPWSCSSSVSSSKQSKRRYPARDMPMEFWVRTDECKILKSRHLEYIDKHYYSREQFIEDTVFFNPMTGERADIVLEPNMFPYQTPPDVEHWTLWSRRDLSEEEVEKWVNEWIYKNKPHVHHWNYDDNAGDRSILWFHVHVYLQYDDLRFVRPRLTGKDVEEEAEKRSRYKRSRWSRSRAVSPDPRRRRKAVDRKRAKC